MQRANRAGANSSLTFTILIDPNIFFADPRVREWLRAVYAALPSTSPGAELELTCTLYVQTGMPLAPCFVEQVSRWANSSLEAANLREPNGTTILANGWVPRQTTGKGKSSTLMRLKVEG